VLARYGKSEGLGDIITTLKNAGENLDGDGYQTGHDARRIGPGFLKEVGVVKKKRMNGCTGVYIRRLRVLCLSSSLGYNQSRLSHQWQGTRKHL
jgi:hypothetical protein